MRASARRSDLLARSTAIAAGVSVLAVIVTSLILAVPALRDRVARNGQVASYSEGDRIDLDPSSYSAADRTIFLFARSSCRACQASKSVMASLVDELRPQPSARVVLVTGLASQGENVEFGREIGIDPERMLEVDLRGLRLRYVPTVVVTDASGRIMMAREGLITESDRQDIVRAALPPVPN
jgi:hypothetical protein